MRLLFSCLLLLAGFSTQAQTEDTVGQGRYLQVRNGGGTAAERIRIFREWQLEAPEAKATNSRWYDQARTDIAASLTAEGRLKEAERYLNDIRTNTLRSLAYLNVAGRLLKDSSFVDAEKLIRKVADTLTRYPGVAEITYERLFGYYGYSLYGQQKYTQAVQKLSAVWQKSRLNDIYLNKYYALSLLKARQYAQAMPVFEKLLISGNASAEVAEHFETVYKHAKGTTAGYALYLDSLRDMLRTHYKTVLQTQLKKEEIADFTLKDLKGETVTLSSFKGKKVVIDYWNNRCAPCLRAFPGLNKAIERYKSDDSVVFLFIEENPTPYEVRRAAVQAFIDKQGYQFRVLLDENDPANPNGRVAKSHKVRALPSKFIIDAEGYLRFQMTGYPDDDIAIMEEISAMLEMI